MVDLIKEIVSGEKIRTRENGFNLDLTYITDRIIAMAFPGSGLETVYRNNINDVVKFITQKHAKKFLVINLSGRTYDYDKFFGQVKEFAWEDHHSPPLELLFDACREMHKFLLQDVNNVVFVHCNAGKGRTGTLICCYLLYSGRFADSKNAMLYYRKKRFQTGGGVTQPSQIRSIKYLEKTFNAYNGLNKRIDPQVIQIDCVKMYGIPKISSNYFRPYIELYTVRTGEMVYSTKDPGGKNKKYKAEDDVKGPIEISFNNSPPVAGDVLLRVYHTATLSSKLAFRFAFNSAFLNVDADNKAVISFSLEELDPDSTKKDSRFPKSFKVEVHIKVRLIDEKDPKFYQNMSLLHREMPEWEKIYGILKDYKPVSKKDSSILLFRDTDRDDVDVILEAKKENQNSDSLSNDGSFSGNELNNSFEDSDGSKTSDDEN